MENKKWRMKQQEYELVVKKDYWTIDEAAMYLASYHLRNNKYVSKEAADKAYYKSHLTMCEILTLSIKEETLPVKRSFTLEYDEYNEECEVVNYLESRVKPITLVRWAIEFDFQIPKEFSRLMGKHRLSTIATHESNSSDYEDVISNETIQKLKELPPHQIKQQVAILAGEKKKWDASIIAATKIGLLFYERGLTKPATRELFIQEYKNHCDLLPELKNTTIERIYRHLPEGYRRTIEGGRLATEQEDILSIIKAAIYAGSIFDTSDVKTVEGLKQALREVSYPMPSDDILLKIVKAISDM